MICPSCQSENDDQAGECVRCRATLVLDDIPTSLIITVDLSPGTLFHSRYEIIGVVGRGGMGMVFEARDRTLDEVVAIKVLRPEFAQDPKMAARFRSEIKLARRVRHKNVCAIHDYGEEQGLLFISMELVKGIDLKRLLRNGPLPADEAYDLAIQVAEGLQAVHEAGIIHRDLKTPNIIRDEDGVARLMDFGIAKREGTQASMTATGHIVGTPEYMSPEQGQGHKVDFRSDLYALGIVAYEIFTGQVPFRGETPISTILKQIHDPPPLDEPVADVIPRDLKPVLAKALEKEPKARYASARDFADALRRSRSRSARQVPLATEALEAPTARQPRRRRERALSPWLLVLPLAAIAAVLVRTTPWKPAAVPVAPDTPVPAASLAAVPPSTPSAPEPSASAPGVATPRDEGASTPAERSVPASPEATPALPSARPVSRPSAQASARPSPSRRAPASRPGGSARLPLPARSTAAPAAGSPIPGPVAVATPPPATSAPVQEEPGFLQVVVRPWAEVAVDGRTIGETPLGRITLAAGTHRVRVRHPAYEAVERSVTVRSGAVERLTVDLPTEGVRRP